VFLCGFEFVFRVQLCAENVVVIMFGAIKTELCQLLFRQQRMSSYLEPLLQWIWPGYMAGRYQAKLLRVLPQAGCLRLRLKVSRFYPVFSAGQHVQLQLLIDGRQLERTFSICSAVTDLQQDSELELAIRVNPAGQFTGRLAGLLKPGMTVHLSAPAGNFAFQPTQAAVMVAAGSGITPLFAMLASVRRLTQPVQLLYFFRGPASPLLADELKELERRFPLLSIDWHDSAQGRVPLAKALVKNQIPAGAQYYLCGPSALMQQWRSTLHDSGVKPSAIWQEHYQGLEMQAEANGALTVWQHSQSRQIAGKGVLLNRLEQHGLKVPSGCRRGVCMQCLCHKQSGVVRNVLTGELSDAGSEYIQLCISEASGAVSLELAGNLANE